MTHLEKLEAIRNACIAVNPEIKELKFGCEVRGNTACPVLVYVGFNNGQHCLLIKKYGLSVKTEDAREGALVFVNKVETEILGRPLTLQDILLAIKKRASVVGWVEILRVFKEYTEVIGNEGALYYFLVENWNIRKSFEEQEKTTIDFIHQILFGN